MSLVSEEEQVRFLHDAVKIVKEQAFYMKRAIDEDSLKLALDHATEMLRELRTNLLTPKNYYELYMKILDEMNYLEDYIISLQKNGRPIFEIYEQVQTCGNIVPRLYLLCCVGSVYIASKEAPAKDILKDMVEMTKGVQHPMRGLFLRNYLTLMTKNKLPDIGSPYEGFGGNTQDACNFILQNFAETNRLWVRLQTQGSSKEKKKREKERLDLRVLVGSNLVRLSQLEGLDINLYKQTILPKVLEEVVTCKDTIAQGYLMDCVIQVFPDDFHLATLDLFLKTCTQLKEKVKVREILEALMGRLANYATMNGNALTPNNPGEISAFKLFNDCIATLIEERTTISLLETLRLQTVLTNFALKCYPARVDYVAHCLSTCSSLIEKSDFIVSSSSTTQSDVRATDEVTIQIETLLATPLSALAIRVLEIPSYSKLMGYLPWGNWKELSCSLLRAVIAAQYQIAEVEQLERLFNAVTPLLRERDGAAPATDEEGRELPLSALFKEEQYLVARVVHLMVNKDDTDTQLRLYVLARKYFTSGGSRRVIFTLPPLVFAALRLSRRVLRRESDAAAGEDPEVTAPQFSTRKVFQFVLEIVTGLAAAYPDQSVGLFLQSAQAADECTFNAIAYEFLKEALLLYECEISESKAQVRCLTAVIGTLLQCKYFSVDDYEALITKVAQYANKLLKKPDQCRMVSLCSHLFWPQLRAVEGPERFADCDRVLECMQRSLKIASVCDPNLFVEILDRYIYYYENNNPSIQARYLSGLVALINEQVESTSGSTPLSPSMLSHYKNTIAYIRARQQAPDTQERFTAIDVGIS